MSINDLGISETADLTVPTLLIEEVAKCPRPGTAVPGELAFSPDDKLTAYLFSPEASPTRQLYALDPETGKHSLLLAPPDGGTKDVRHMPRKLEDRFYQVERVRDFSYQHL